MEPKHLGQEGKFASNQTDFAPTQYYLARGLTISNQEFKSETLLAAPIRDDEIFELLERLAATEEMFKTPVSTIRDVAELTEASPNLIARILGEMRGPGELEKIVDRIDMHEERLRAVEKKVSQPMAPPILTNQPYVIPTSIPALRKTEPTRVRANSQANSNEAWARYRKRLEQDQAEENNNSEERLFGLTPLTIVIAIIVILSCFGFIMTKVDKGIDQPSNVGPYPSNWNP